MAARAFTAQSALFGESKLVAKYERVLMAAPLAALIYAPFAMTTTRYVRVFPATAKVNAFVLDVDIRYPLLVLFAPSYTFEATGAGGV